MVSSIADNPGSFSSFQAQTQVPIFKLQEVSRRSASTVISKSDVVRIHVPYQPDDVVTVSGNPNTTMEGGGGRGSPSKRAGAESR